MEAIFKVVLPVRERQFQLPLPQGAAIMHINVQDNLPVMWYRFTVTPAMEPTATAVMSSRMIRVVTTGEQFQPPKGTFWYYLGTALMNHGQFVLHYFEEGINA